MSVADGVAFHSSQINEAASIVAGRIFEDQPTIMLRLGSLAIQDMLVDDFV